ncbi:redoxin domain-containing protein [Candidatus Kaiserbacteria bacterium]|nr:redoxin domain-containing protein [Candidatus Kaiserbacteria bacterium]
MRQALLHFGEPAPWFVAPCTSNPVFHFSSVGGRYVVLCFFQSAARAESRQILRDFLLAQSHFDDYNACFFGVSTDPDDQRLERVREQIPGIRFFWDFDRAVSRLYGAVVDSPVDAGAQSAEVVRPHTLLLDPLLRVVTTLPFGDSPETHVPRVLKALAELPPVGPPTVASPQAPVLIVPRVFEPELCRTLVQYYETHGGQESGFMRERNGMTVEVTDYGHKRRRDQEIADERLRHACMIRIHDRLVPEIHKAFQFRATRIERYVVACYDASVAGHFRAHRDNTTKGTAHRRFAVSLHLNTGEYEGGYLRFPEFGPQLYIAPMGGAVVFSCSLLHEATPVTRGLRFMFLPFLYDDQAARIRQQNLGFIEPSVSPPRPS